MKRVVSVLGMIGKIASIAFGIALVLYVVVGGCTSAYFGLRDSPAFESREVSVLWQREGAYTYAVCDSENVYMYDAEDSLAIGDVLTLTCYNNGTATDTSVPDVEVVAGKFWGFCDAVGIICFVSILLMLASCVAIAILMCAYYKRQSPQT